MLLCLILLLAIPEVLPQPIDTPNTAFGDCTSQEGKQYHIQNIYNHFLTLINKIAPNLSVSCRNLALGYLFSLY